MRVRDLNWMQLEEYLQRDDRIVLPVGSTEQHAYLSLETDNIIAERLAVEAAEPLGVPVLPVLAYGLTQGFAAFPGSPTLHTPDVRGSAARDRRLAPRSGLPPLPDRERPRRQPSGRGRTRRVEARPRGRGRAVARRLGRAARTRSPPRSTPSTTMRPGRRTSPGRAFRTSRCRRSGSRRSRGRSGSAGRRPGARLSATVRSGARTSSPTTTSCASGTPRSSSCAGNSSPAGRTSRYYSVIVHHDHDHRLTTDRRALTVALVLVAAVMVGEIVAGHARPLARAARRRRAHAHRRGRAGLRADRLGDGGAAGRRTLDVRLLAARDPRCAGERHHTRAARALDRLVGRPPPYRPARRARRPRARRRSRRGTGQPARDARARAREPGEPERPRRVPARRHRRRGVRRDRARRRV